MTFLKDESGQGMVEYALIIGLVAVVAVVALVALGPRIKNMFNSANNSLASAEPSSSNG